jgi:crossover junction endodeoxyribonuclease RusA
MTTSKSVFPKYVKPRFIFKLPYPPTINHYYGLTRTGQRFIGKKGTEFRKQVVELLREIPESSNTLGKDVRIQVWIEVFCPDRRKRDLDNIKKPLLDSLTHAGVWEDDCQVDDIRSVRCEVTKGGYVRVHVAILSDSQD